MKFTKLIIFAYFLAIIMILNGSKARIVGIGLLILTTLVAIYYLYLEFRIFMIRGGF